MASPLRLIAFTLALITLSLCNLSNDDIDKEGKQVSNRRRNRISSWEQALGYQECEAYMPKIRPSLGNKANQPKLLSDICSKFACPRYKALNITGCGFGARQMYASSSWVSTGFEMKDREASSKKAYWDLRKYRLGENDANERLPMTVPVLTSVHLDLETLQPLETAYMSFYHPSSSPPTPLNPALSIDPSYDNVVFYRVFRGPGYPSEEEKEEEFERLRKAITEAGLPFYPYWMMSASYTRPGQGRQRWEAIYVAQ